VTQGELATDLNDPKRWMNPHLVTRYIASAIEREGADIRYVAGDVAPRTLQWAHRKQRLYRMLRGQRYLIEHHPPSLQSIAQSVADELRKEPFDVVFCPSTIPIAQLDCPQPIVFWTDANFAGMIDYYPYYTGLCRRSILQGHAMEQAALSRCTLAIYASNWAADTAREAYDFDQSKLRVLCRAPNLETHPTLDQVNGWIAQRPRDRIELLFVGNDSHRKGGDIAIQIARCLHDSGQPVRLRLLGQEAEKSTHGLPDFVDPMGFVSKANAAGREQFNRIMASSHLLLLPTRAECLSIVTLEASAFGVPTIGCRTGGTPDAIEPGVSGQLFDPDTPAQDWAQYIGELFADHSAYDRLAQASYNRYATKFNWQSIGRQLYALLEEAANTVAH
jgi:glycosyltransferase involved in cell wall biosynthesis